MKQKMTWIDYLNAALKTWRLQRSLTNKDYLKPGEIVLADPGYTDQKEKKIRPLLIISGKLLHQNTNYAVCVGITTSREPHPYLIQLSPKDIEDGRLNFDSQVMCHRIVSLKQTELRKIARLTPNFYEKIIKKIKQDVMEG